MKRVLMILAACLLLCLPLACAQKPAEAAEPPAVSVPETPELTLTLPLGTRDAVTKTIPSYAAGFSAKGGEALTLSLASADPTVAEGVLKDDGTLYVIARGVGETKITVTARTASGEENAATVSVTVRDARRTLALIVLGVLSVALLALLGKPSAKKPEAEAAAKPEGTPDEPEETPDPVVIIEEEPKKDPERS
jgi:type IV pilus biogenesis protein CpaD/CtpE